MSDTQVEGTGRDAERAAAMRRAAALAEDHLRHRGERPVWPRVTFDDMVAALGGELPEGPSDPTQVVEELAKAAEPGITAMSSGRFFGFVIGGTHPAALGADWLASAWDQNAGLTASAPANAACEAVAGSWLLDLLGLPEQASVGFVTGGMQANFTCLGAARHAVLDRVGWDVETRGLNGAPETRVLAGADRHDTIDLSLRYLGLGTDSVAEVATDDQGRIRLEGLEAALTGDAPTIVCLQAGEVHTGASDPLRDAIALAHEHRAWVHVDGAFGLWAAASPATRHLVDGLEDADSWATDGHKTLNVPYDCGFAIVRDTLAHRAAFGIHGVYLVTTDAGDPLELVPEFSRRARGFPVWAVLRSLGRSGVADLVDRLCRNARRMADGIAAIPGARVLNDVTFTQVLARFGAGDDEGREGGEGGDRITAEVARRVLEDGTAVMTPSTWRGRAVLRCSMSDWSTTDEDVDRTLAALERIAAEVGGTS